MFLLNTKISAKSLTSLKKFLGFLLKLNLYNKKVQLTLTVLKILNIKYGQQNKIISILTSPQANKNAQEQFLFKKHSRNMFLFSFDVLKILVLLKKIKIFIFSEIKIQLSFLHSKKKIKNITERLFNPERIKPLRITKHKKKANLKNKLFLHLFKINTIFKSLYSSTVEQRTENSWAVSSNLTLSKKILNYEKLLVEHVQ